MQYAATRFEKDGEYGEIFTAASRTDAERICAVNCWRLDGDNAAIVRCESDAEAYDIIGALNERDVSICH